MKKNQMLRISREERDTITKYLDELEEDPHPDLAENLEKLIKEFGKWVCGGRDGDAVIRQVIDRLEALL